MTPPSPHGHSPAAYGDPNARAATRREIVRFMLLAFGLTWGAGGLALIIGRLNAGRGPHLRSSAVFPRGVRTERGRADHDGAT